MSKLIHSEVISVDVRCKHKVEVSVEFDEPITTYEAQSIINKAIGNYMDKQCELKEQKE